MVAKRFFYVCARLLCVALTYHLGAQSATAQSHGNPVEAVGMVPSEGSLTVGIPTASGESRGARRVTNPAFAVEEAASSSQTGSATGGGWPLPVKLLVTEGSIGAMSSCGYIAEAAGEPPKSGAYVLGATLLTGGSLVLCLLPMALGTANSQQDRESTYLMGVACLALVAVGGYNLYLNANNEPTSAQILRDDMIALNAVPLVTWATAKAFHWHWRVR